MQNLAIERAVEALLNLYEVYLETESAPWDEEYAPQAVVDCLDRLYCAGSPHGSRWPQELQDRLGTLNERYANLHAAPDSKDDPDYATYLQLKERFDG